MCVHSMHQKNTQGTKTYSHIYAIFLSINYAVGTGILNLPHNVASASIGGSIIIMTLISVLIYMIAQYSLETISKTFALVRAKMIRDQDQTKAEFENMTENTSVSTNLHTVEEQVVHQDLDFILPNDRTYQVSALCKIHLGKPGFYIYQIALILLIFGGTWSYATAISQNLVSIIPMYALPNYKAAGSPGWVCTETCAPDYANYCSDAYWIWTVITCVFSVIMVFFNLIQQRHLQAVFTGIRFLVFILTLVLIIYCLSTQPFLNRDQYTNGNFINPNIKTFSATAVEVGALFSSYTFSQIYHHSIPGIIQPTKQNNPKSIIVIILVSFVLLYAITILIALPGGLYFGTDGVNLVTLNFNNWTGYDFSGGPRNAFITFLSYLMRILPPLYLIASMPLRGLTISLNIQQMLSQKARSKTWTRALINVVCVVPPILLAGGVRCISVVINFTGLAGYIVIIMPTIAAFKAQLTLEKKAPGVRCPYSTFFSNKWVMLVPAMFNMVAFVVTLYSVIKKL